MLSAFFGGYAATQLLGGQLADDLGAKWVLAIGLGCWSLATALTPLAAALGAAPLLATRLALGLGEGSGPASPAGAWQGWPSQRCTAPSDAWCPGVSAPAAHRRASEVEAIVRRGAGHGSLLCWGRAGHSG